MMWFSFFLACLICVLVLYVPGYLILKACGLSRQDSVCSAPLITTAGIALEAIAFGVFGIRCGAFSLLTPLFSVGVVINVVAGICARFGRKKQTMDLGLVLSWQTMLLYILLSSTVVLLVFVKGLDGPESLLQEFDNFWHLGLTSSFLQSGNYSSFGGSLYAGTLGEATSPFIQTNSFYPSAWHAITAVVTELSGCSVALNINVVNTVLMSFVFPLSMCRLLCVLYDGENSVLRFGSVACAAFTAFPLDFVSFGPLYPNLLSMSILPSFAAAFISLFDRELVCRHRLVQGFLFVVGAIAVAVAQPNGIFSAAVFLAPFCVFTGYSLSRNKGVSKRGSYLVAMVVALAIGVAWLVLYKSPAFSFVVSFNWPATESLFQGFVDVLTLGFTDHSAQLLLSLVVLFAVFNLACDSKRSWLVVSAGIASIIYILSVSTEGGLKHLLGGFWYTDPHRLAATCAFVYIPLAAYGFSRFFDLLSRYASSSGKGMGFVGLVTAVFVSTIFMPSFTIKGITDIETSFGAISNKIDAQNNAGETKVLSAEELDFSKRALSMIPPGSLVLNEPNDGSAFLYSLCDANMYYRQFALPSNPDEETGASRLLRESLAEVAENVDVQNAVHSLDAQYLLVRDLEGHADYRRRYFWSYYPDQWSGIDAVNDTTPGFEVLMSEGDMRLYRIVA